MILLVSSRIPAAGLLLQFLIHADCHFAALA
jgi:hypothetical protein